MKSVLEEKLEKLFSDLDVFIECDPLLIERLNEYTQKHWAKYLSLEKVRRDKLARNATMYMLYSWKRIQKKDLPYLVDAVKFNYPTGYPKGGCPADKTFLDKFIKALTEAGLTPEDSWIKDVKEFSEVYKTLLEQQTTKSEDL